MGYLKYTPYTLVAALSFSVVAATDVETDLQEYAKQAVEIKRDARAYVGDFEPELPVQARVEPQQSVTSLIPNKEDYQSALDAMGIKADATPLLTDQQRCDAGSRESCAAVDARHGTFIFVSSSMHDAEIRSALTHAKNVDAEVIVRGIQPGESLDQAFRFWHALAESAGVVPEVRIDPELFKRFDIQTVPTIVHEDTSGVARVSGMSNAQWLIEQVSINGRQDYGLRGTTVEIAERDLIEEMKERVANVDWDKQTTQAKKRMWSNFDYVNLPRADKPASRLLDPTMTVTRDVVTQDGRLIAAAGTQLNSLKTIGLSRRYLVFDPTDLRQFELVQSKYQAGDWSDRPLTILFTQVDHADGNATLKKVFTTFKTKAYLYTDLIQAKFGLTALPSTVEQSGHQLLINTYSPSRTGD